MTENKTELLPDRKCMICGKLRNCLNCLANGDNHKAMFPLVDETRATPERSELATPETPIEDTQDSLLIVEDTLSDKAETLSAIFERIASNSVYSAEKYDDDCETIRAVLQQNDDDIDLSLCPVCYLAHDKKQDESDLVKALEKIQNLRTCTGLQFQVEARKIANEALSKHKKEKQ